MGRMHSRGKGISASALSYKHTPPSWAKISSQDVEENICKFAKKGLTDRCDPQGLAWYPSGWGRHWQQDPAHYQSSWYNVRIV